MADQRNPSLELKPNPRRAVQFLLILCLPGFMYVVAHFTVYGCMAASLSLASAGRIVAYSAAIILVPASGFLFFWRSARDHRWVVNDGGIEIIAGGKVARSVRWDDVRKVVLRTHGISLVVEGEAAQETICFVGQKAKDEFYHLYFSKKPWGGEDLSGR